jgi:predicted nucleotidyltransferase
MNEICIDQNQRKIVLGILKKHFVSQKFYVFGSRANHKNLKPFSDLDIAIFGLNPGASLSLDRASEDFSASDLPFKVDLIDINSISTEFRNNIEPDFVELK